MRGWLLVEGNENDTLRNHGEVLGFNKSWINEDFNPDGICMCFLGDDGWTIAKWCGSCDEWHTRVSNPDCVLIESEPAIDAPTHFMFKPQKPQ